MKQAWFGFCGQGGYNRMKSKQTAEGAEESLFFFLCASLRDLNALCGKHFH